MFFQNDRGFFTFISSQPYLSLSAELQEYFDYSAYGSDLQGEYGGEFVSGGYVFMQGMVRLEDILSEAQGMEMQ